MLKKIIILSAFLTIIPTLAMAAKPLNLIVTYENSAADPVDGVVLYFKPEQIENASPFLTGNQSFNLGTPTNTGTNTFATVQEAIDYYAPGFFSAYLSDIETLFPGEFEEGDVFLIEPVVRGRLDDLDAADIAFSSAMTLVQGDISDLETSLSGHTHAYSSLTGLPTLFSGAYADLTGKPTLFDGTWASLTGKPSVFTPDAHTHAQSDITGLAASLAAKQDDITPGSHINNAATDAATDAATNAATNATTNASASSVTILGISVPTNASYVALVDAYNDLATKYNDAAGKYNAAAAKYNAAAAKYNDAAAKFNTLVDSLEAQGIQTP